MSEKMCFSVLKYTEPLVALGFFCLFFLNLCTQSESFHDMYMLLTFLVYLISLVNDLIEHPWNCHLMKAQLLLKLIRRGLDCTFCSLWRVYHVML